MNIPKSYEALAADLASEKIISKTLLGQKEAYMMLADSRKIELDDALARESELKSGLKTTLNDLHGRDDAVYDLRIDLKAAQDRESALLEELRKWKETAWRHSQDRDEIQQRLTVAEQRSESITGKASFCKDCGSSDLFWFAHNTVPNGIQQNRLNTHDVECLFFLGCNHCSATLKQVSADRIAEKITAALKPAAEGEGS